MESTAAQVHANSTPLQARQVALLDELARCDRGLQCYQLALAAGARMVAAGRDTERSVERLSQQPIPAHTQV